jgi:CheY-like chemotaxis protein
MTASSFSATETPGQLVGLADPASKSNLVAAPQPGYIMLIEDDFILRGSLAAVLHAEGYRVECAANALDALQRLERPPRPCVILLDILLPYMDGLEFRALQRRTRDIADIPVIVITAVGIRPEVADELELRQAFSKPLDRAKLLHAIRTHCAPCS